MELFAKLLFLLLPNLVRSACENKPPGCQPSWRTDPLWKDGIGRSCAQGAGCSNLKTWCLSANQACCHCGGGNIVPDPTGSPSEPPTVPPTSTPSSSPSSLPTSEPTASPTMQPSKIPTSVPTHLPTAQPTTQPTTMPTTVPTGQPTTQPTAQPTARPTTLPTTQPTTKPSALPNPSNGAESPAEAPSYNATRSPSPSFSGLNGETSNSGSFVFVHGCIFWVTFFAAKTLVLG